MEKRLNDRQLDELIRDASPRAKVPAGLEIGIMARVARSECRRRERRAIAEMAGWCVKMSAALAAVAFAALNSLDLQHNWPAVALILAGVVGVAVTVSYDRAHEIFRKLDPYPDRRI